MSLRFAKSLLTATALLIAASSWPVHAQQKPNNAQLTKQFRDGFLKGCLQGKRPGVKSQRKYCTCMANSYQSRYDGRTLAAITQVAGTLGDQGPALVNLMVAPEAKTCTARN